MRVIRSPFASGSAAACHHPCSSTIARNPAAPRSAASSASGHADMDTVTPRDIFLAKELSAEAAARFLEHYGPRDGAAADQNLQQLADELPSRLALGDLAPTLLDILSTTPDPDAALVGFCRYVGARTPKAAFVRELAADPRLLDILMQILGTSPFLRRDPDPQPGVPLLAAATAGRRAARPRRLRDRAGPAGGQRRDRRAAGERTQALPAAGDAARGGARSLRDAQPGVAGDDHHAVVQPGRHHRRPDAAHRRRGGGRQAGSAAGAVRNHRHGQARGRRPELQLRHRPHLRLRRVSRGGRRGPRTLPEARAASHEPAGRPYRRGLPLPRRHAPAADGRGRQPRLLAEAVGAVLREPRRDVRAFRDAEGAADRRRPGARPAVRRHGHAVRLPQVPRSPPPSRSSRATRRAPTGNMRVTATSTSTSRRAAAASARWSCSRRCSS